MANKKCPKCGEEIIETWNVHYKCGWNVDDKGDKPFPKQPKPENEQIKPITEMYMPPFKDFDVQKTFRDCFNFVENEQEFKKYAPELKVQIAITMAQTILLNK